MPFTDLKLRQPWTAVDAGGSFKECWIQPCLVARAKLLSSSCCFFLLLPKQSNRMGTVVCFSLLAKLQHCRVVPHFYGANVLSFACHQHVRIGFFLTAFFCDIKTWQWTNPPFGFPSDPWWSLKDWTGVALAKLFNIYHVNVEMFKIKVKKFKKHAKKCQN